MQAPYKVDLPGDMTYQYTWVPMLQAATGCTPGGIKGGGEEWVKAFGAQIPPLLAARQAARLPLHRRGNVRKPNNKGHIPTTMEWARKLTKNDIGILTRQGAVQREGARTSMKASRIADVQGPGSVPRRSPRSSALGSPRRSKNARSATWCAKRRPTMCAICNNSPGI